MTGPSIRESATSECAPGPSAAGEADANASSAARLLNVAVGLSDARTLRDVAEVLLDRALPAVDAAGGFIGFVEKEHLRVLAGRGYPFSSFPGEDRSV